MNSESATLYEEYATSRPYFDDDDLPPGLLQAVQSASGSFLEVGAGDGGKLVALQRRGCLSAYTTVTASDIAELRAERIRTKLPAASVFVADAVALPLEAASIDFYLSDQVIEHVADDGAMIDELIRVLRPGGTAYVGSVIKNPGAWYVHRNGGQWRLDPTHVREYASREAYLSVFTRRGLEVLDCFTVDVAYPICDLAVRALFRLRLVPIDLTTKRYQQSALIHRIRQLKIGIPGYQCVYATLCKAPGPKSGAE